jgi:hypothetical protein
MKHRNHNRRAEQHDPTASILSAGNEKPQSKATIVGKIVVRNSYFSLQLDFSSFVRPKGG